MSSRKVPKPIDPTDWANKQKAAKEHAKRLKEERLAQSTGDASFAPQINKRPSYLGDNPKPQASSNRPAYDPNDVFEQPLPGKGNDIFEQPLPGAGGGKNKALDIFEQPLGASKNKPPQQYEDYTNASPPQTQPPRGGRREGSGGPKPLSTFVNQNTSQYNNTDYDDGNNQDPYRDGGGSGGNYKSQFTQQQVQQQGVPSGGKPGRNAGNNPNSYGGSADGYEDAPTSNQTYSTGVVGGGRNAVGGRRAASKPAAYDGYDEDYSQGNDNHGGNTYSVGSNHNSNARMQQQQHQQSGGNGSKPAGGRGGRRQQQQGSGGGWNDDFVSANTLGGASAGGGGGGPQLNMSNRPPFQNNVDRDDFLDNMDQAYDHKVKKKPGAYQQPPLQQQQAQHDDNDVSPRRQQQPRGGRRAVGNNSRQQQNNDVGGGWNNDTAVEYRDDDQPPPRQNRASPRAPAQHGNARMQTHSQPSTDQIQSSNPHISVSSSADVEKARSGLSLLKSRIRGSGGSSNNNSTNSMGSGNDNGSGGSGSMNSRSMRIAPSRNAGGQDSSSNRVLSAPNEYAYNDNGGNKPHQRGGYGGNNNESSMMHNGPSPRRDDCYGDQQDEYVPTAVAVPSKQKRSVPNNNYQQQHQQQPGGNSKYYANNYDDDMDTPPKPAQKSHHQPQQQRQQPPQQQRQPAANNYQQQEEAAAAREDAQYGGAALDGLGEDAFAGEVPQNECPDCGRKFNDKAYERHVKVCKKVFIEKRKAFDMTKQRVADNPEALKLLKKTKEEEKRKARQDAIQQQKMLKKQGGGGGGNFAEEPIQSEKIPKWKADRQQFLDALKSAKEYAAAKDSGKPLPPPVISAPDPSLVPCPHCGRRFNEKAAERHIPQCNNIKARPSTLKKGAGTGIGSASHGTSGKTAGGSSMLSKPKKIR